MNGQCKSGQWKGKVDEKMADVGNEHVEHHPVITSRSGGEHWFLTLEMFTAPGI